MKVSLIIIFFCFNLYSFSQTKDDYKSNVDVFTSKTGMLLEKEFIPIQQIVTGSGLFKKNLEIKVLKVTDLLNNQVYYSLRFEFLHTSNYNSDLKVGNFDSDEVNALLKILQLMDSEYLKSTKTNYTELTYISRGGTRIGCFYSESKWTIYFKLEEFDKDSYVYLNSIDISALYSAILLAKPKMKL